MSGSPQKNVLVPSHLLNEDAGINFISFYHQILVSARQQNRKKVRLRIYFVDKINTGPVFGGLLKA